MAKQKQSGSFTARTEEIIREEAMKIARATQTPGQTKEQTKLIAKGIANGIAVYKKQEKIRQRDRTRQQKKHHSAETTALRQDPGVEPVAEPLSSGFNRLPGLTASGIFLLAGLVHLLRLVTGTEITIGTFAVPVYWSGAAGVAALMLAIWIYRVTKSSDRIIRRTGLE